jgi:microcystin-dependent protein
MEYFPLVIKPFTQKNKLFMEGYIAQILFFAGNFPPRYWAFCEGQILSIASNTALFSLIGTMYGGNGTTTFALPDFRGRVPMGMGQGPGLPDIQQGQLLGASTVTLTTLQIPSHAHSALASIAAASTNGNNASPVGNIFATSTANSYGPTANGAAAGTTLTLATTGGNQPFSVQQPTLALNFVICLNGIFPSRN